MGASGSYARRLSANVASRSKRDCHHARAWIKRERVAKATKASKTKAGAGEHRGEIVDVVRALLAEGRGEEVLGVVTQLVARNSELERRLAQLLSRAHKNEGLSSAQLLLFLNDLAEGKVANDEGDANSDARTDANDKLRTASGIDEAATAESETEPQRQPPVRKPPPASWPRIDNPIEVPAQERRCPRCGGERTCIGHDVTEVIELVPAQLVVRRDMREKLACPGCEGEIVRAPLGDKVVAGGRLGSRLVSELVVDKYSDGLPLHRQKERFARMGLDISVSTLADQVTWATDSSAPSLACGDGPGARREGDASRRHGPPGARSRGRGRQASRDPLGLRRRPRRRALPLHVDGEEERAAPSRARARRHARSALRLRGRRRVESLRHELQARRSGRVWMQHARKALLRESARRGRHARARPPDRRFERS